MRSTNEVRSYLIDNLMFGFENPAMLGGTAFGVELAFSITLDHLFFLDEHPVPPQELLKARHHFSAGGTYGLLREMLPGRQNLCCEIASVYAEVFADAGYLPHAERLGRERWLSMAHSLADHTALRSFTTVEEAMAVFGPPTFVVSPRGSERVLCYASDSTDDGAWLFLDFRCELPAGKGGCILADVRYPYWFGEARVIMA